MGSENAHSGRFLRPGLPVDDGHRTRTGILRVRLRAVRNDRNSSASGYFCVCARASVDKSPAIARRLVRHFSVSNQCADETPRPLLRSFGLIAFYLWACIGIGTGSRQPGQELHPCAGRHDNQTRFGHGDPGMVPNVRRAPSTRLPLTGYILESRKCSPSEVVGSCKGSPTSSSQVDGPSVRRVRTRYEHPMEKLWCMRAAPDAPACLSHRRKTLRDADTMTRAAQALMRLHRTMQMRDRERMPIEALTLCGRCHRPEVATNRSEQVTMQAATGYPIVRIVSGRRVVERGGLGTE